MGYEAPRDWWKHDNDKVRRARAAAYWKKSKRLLKVIWYELIGQYIVFTFLKLSPKKSSFHQEVQRFWAQMEAERVAIHSNDKIGK